jgi:hypothetical protein
MGGFSSIGGAVTGGGIPDAPDDGLLYGRRNEAWEPAPDYAYVDAGDANLQGQINQLAAGLIYCGAYDVANDQGTFTAASGIPNGPLPPANQSPPVTRGEYVVCTSAGIGRGNAPAVPIAVGDQLISGGPGSGPIWQLLPVGGAAATADAVALNPPIPPWTNVQEAIEGLNTNTGGALRVVVVNPNEITIPVGNQLQTIYAGNPITMGRGGNSWLGFQFSGNFYQTAAVGSAWTVSWQIQGGPVTPYRWILTYHYKGIDITLGTTGFDLSLMLPVSGSNPRVEILSVPRAGPQALTYIGAGGGLSDEYRMKLALTDAGPR